MLGFKRLPTICRVSAGVSDNRADIVAKSCPRVRLRVRAPSGQPDPRFRRNVPNCNDLERAQKAPLAPKKRPTPSRTPARNRSRALFPPRSSARPKPP